jgi:hypothetical protein
MREALLKLLLIGKQTRCPKEKAFETSRYRRRYAKANLGYLSSFMWTVLGLELQPLFVS